MNKKFYLIIGLLILCLDVNAQQDAEAAKKAKDIKEITFWGVDYSLTRFAAGISSDKAHGILWPINYLFIEEPDKYNTGKFFGKKVKNDFSVIKEKTEKIDIDSLITSDLSYKITPEQVANLIKELPLTENIGTGLIVIGELMSKIKSKEEGLFYIVFFDHATKDIIFIKHVSGKPGGFGLRNYWAKSVYNVMNKWKYKP